GDPLARGQQVGAGAGGAGAALGRDPLGAGGDTDLVGAAVVTHHGAHGVGAVAVVVTRGRATHAGRVEPVEHVAAGGGATVLAHQRRVVELHTGVDVGHHHTLAGDPEVAP